jgi:hypothetical protein
VRSGPPGVLTAATRPLGVIPYETGEDPMNTITSDPGQPGEPPGLRPAYSAHVLLHNVLRILAAHDCKVVITKANVGPAVRAARDLLPAFSIEPDIGAP